MKCLKPARLGALTLRNRIIMPPMVTNYSADDGGVTPRYLDYMEARAKGGVGLIIVEASSVHPSGKGFPNGVCIHDDSLIPGLKTLVERVHAHGAKIAIQLHHGGRQTSPGVTGRPLVAPSDWSGPGEPARAMTIEEIGEIIEAFGKAAERAVAAGFDAVEIHGAHGYLLTEFLSNYTNKRTDQYGGSIANRVRLSREIIARVRRSVGDEYTVLYRLTTEEDVPDGITVNEAEQIVEELLAEKIDGIHVVAGNYECTHMIIAPMAVRQGCNAERAERVRRAVSGRVPVIVAGRIKDIAMAEDLIDKGCADFVAMGRALIADPDMPAKAAKGDFAGIRKCIGCNDGCLARLFAGLDISCTVNAAAGREAEYDLGKKAAPPKRIAVIGGGPAGMEAARVAAVRGHEVHLLEKTGRLGGALPIASLPPYKTEINDFTDYLTAQMLRLGVKVRLNTDADADTVRQLAPDALIVATGGTPITGLFANERAANVRLAQDVLTSADARGGNAVIVGGGLIGCETAEFLAEAGVAVTVLEMCPALAPNVEGVGRELMLERLKQLRVTTCTNARVLEINPGAVAYESEGVRREIKGVDTIVLALGNKQNVALLDALAGTAPAVQGIGDCVKPGKIIDAVHSAFEAAYSL